MSRVKIILLLILIFSLVIISCGRYKDSNATGAIRGVVKDETGKPIANARVVIDDKVTTTNKEGEFYIENIPAGEYKIYISAYGFTTYSKKVTIYAGRISFIEVILKKDIGIPHIPGAEGSCFGSYLYDEPPIIYSVKQDKISPTAGEEVTITANIANDIEVTDEITTQARIIYSIDGGKTWERVDMEQDKNDARIWRGRIKGHPSGTKVIYYLQAIDSAGSLTTETPGESPEDAWRKLKEGTAAGLPDSGILFTYPVDDEDCDERECPPGNDILKFSFAYSKKDIMVKLQVQADEIDIGTLSPVGIASLAFTVLNMDLGGYKEGKALMFAPLAKELPGWKDYGVNRDTIPFDASVADTKIIPPQEVTGDDAVVKGDTLYLKFAREWLGQHPSGHLKAISTSSVALTTDIAAISSNFKPYDASPFIRVYMRNHAYTVK